MAPVSDAGGGHATEAEGRMVDAFPAFLLDGEYDAAAEIFEELSASRDNLAGARDSASEGG